MLLFIPQFPTDKTQVPYPSQQMMMLCLVLGKKKTITKTTLFFKCSIHLFIQLILFVVPSKCIPCVWPLLMTSTAIILASVTSCLYSCHSLLKRTLVKAWSFFEVSVLVSSAWVTVSLLNSSVYSLTIFDFQMFLLQIASILPPWQRFLSFSLICYHPKHLSLSVTYLSYLITYWCPSNRI